MKDIYILGSGGFAKEVYFLIKEINKYNVKGFIDIESSDSLIFKEKSIPILSEEEFLILKFETPPSLAIGVGEPKLIDKLTNKFKNFHFPNLIHPSVVFDKENVTFGIGNIVTAGVIFTTQIRIENFNIFNLSTTIGHDVFINSYNVINPTVNISGGVEIGSCNLLGVAATILQYKKIGNNSTVGASSLVTKDVGDNQIVFGVPAKKFNK
ncbi:hypothetical protein AWE51_22360 [Aquimarina aggregata]|uniref:PglD N-terminal domain-containing protein n=1 Tax=Aquimarina aggregata TaxID=1642818 RepID=A0A162CUZ5_9FLAO|nr:acetyltransferase [Aquimarina aggregata]KZS41449.1 hypothetical protein AWE51_22360 [Aquimarina aggregata]